VQRLRPFFQDGESIPQSWGELTFTRRLGIESGDPEAAAVFKGQMSAELEAKVLSGKWSGDPVPPRDLAAEKEAAIQAALAGLGPVKEAEQLEAERRERLALDATNRMNSLVQATGRWEQG